MGLAVKPRRSTFPPRHVVASGPAWTQPLVRMLVRSRTLTLSVLWLAACQSPPGEAYDHIEGTGTERMVAILAEIHATAEADPMPYFHMNRARAAKLRERARQASGEERLVTEVLLAQELLYAGLPRDAIDVLLGLESALPRPGRIDRMTAPLYDLLALAYMRLGEEENCTEHPSERACLLPITGDGVHVRTDGSRGAARLYEELLRVNPADLQSQWLYNLAVMTLGEWPDGVHERMRIQWMGGNGAPFPGFTDVAILTGVPVEAMSGGASADDFTGNGLIDLLVTGYGLDEQTRLLINDGHGQFIDRTAEAGLTGIVSGLNTVHADFDNDGHTDVLILRGAWLGDHGGHPNSLLRNNGDGTFGDVTFKAGLGQFHPSHTAAWADFNGNGHLDLFVGNESGAAFDAFSGVPDSSSLRRSHLFLNNGDGTFSEVSASVGIDLEAFVKGAVWCDLTNNGLPDLYVSVLGEDNRLYVNEGEAPGGGWRFVERAAAAGVTEPIFSFPVGCLDYDQDGLNDLLVLPYDVRRFSQVAADAAAEALRLATPAERPRLFRNNGDGTFSDVTEEAGLRIPIFSMGFNFGDLDNDGYPDFYVGTGAPDLRALVPNRMFRNRGDGRFEEVTFSGGFAHIQKGHGVAFADFRNGGRVDVFVNVGGAVEGDRFRDVLFASPGFDHRWIGLHLEGRRANRSAIGARIRVRVETADGGARDIFRSVSTGGSFGANPLRQVVGLGTAERLLEVEVRWPYRDGETQSWHGLELDTYYRLVEGDAAARQLDLVRVEYPTPSVPSQAQ
jgi:hypothetical protein